MTKRNYLIFILGVFLGWQATRTAACRCIKEPETESSGEAGYILMLCELCYNQHSPLGALHDEWTWDLALEMCEKQDGRLAVLNSLPKTQRAYHLLQAQNSTRSIQVWTAAVQTGQVWSWAFNETISRLWNKKGKEITSPRLYRIPPSHRTVFDLLLTKARWIFPSRTPSEKRPYNLWGYLCEIKTFPVEVDKHVPVSRETDTTSKEPSLISNKPEPPDQNSRRNIIIPVAVAAACFVLLVGVIIITLVIRHRRPEGKELLDDESATYRDPELHHKTEIDTIDSFHIYASVKAKSPRTKTNIHNISEIYANNFDDDPEYSDIEYSNNFNNIEEHYASIDDSSRETDTKTSMENKHTYYELETVTQATEQGIVYTEVISDDKQEPEYSHETTADNQYEKCVAENDNSSECTHQEQPQSTQNDSACDPSSAYTQLVENDLYKA